MNLNIENINEKNKWNNINNNKNNWFDINYFLINKNLII